MPMRLTSRLRWFWRAYAALTIIAIVAVIGLPLGPTIEQRFFPIRGPQSISAVTRADGRLCWDWSFVKLRGPASDNLDAYLTVGGEPGGVVAPFDEATGHYWGLARMAVSPRPEPYRLRYCVALPPYVTPADTVRVQQTAFYPGYTGLWRLAVTFPDVVSEGAPP